MYWLSCTNVKFVAQIPSHFTTLLSFDAELTICNFLQTELLRYHGNV
jgi:hypothetical protein